MKTQNGGLLHDIIFSIRLPRTLSAFVSGGLLALGGALMQILLRNPLADPYVLGVSGGAAVTTLLLLFFGITGVSLVSGAWIGSLASILLLFVFAKRNQPWNTQRVLLTGVALASGFSALISFILLVSPEHELRGMLFWLIGDLSFAHTPIIEAVILFLGLMVSFYLAPELNILLRGEQEARALGVHTQRLQMILYLVSSALTAAAVTLAGCIGFVGLIVPHTLRLLGLHDQRFLLPAAVLLGGSLLTIADTLARILISPQQLPVGIMMALVGIPTFLILLQKNS
jgi:iron complex transport system permease protein